MMQEKKGISGGSFLLPGIGLAYLAIFTVLLHDYFLWSANVLMGILLAPYICVPEKGKYSLRYLIPCLAACGILLLVPVKTTLFLALLFSTLLLAENSLGKINSSLLFLLLLISPLFTYLSNTLGFPARLWLSGISALILNTTGANALASGNIIVLDNYEFSVDQACAGLNMLATSVIICLFIIAFYRRKFGKRLSFMQVFLVLAGTVLLNILSNLFRIVMLVLFKIMPGNFLHDLTGVICLAVYVILPLVYSLKLFIVNYGRKSPAYDTGSGNPAPRYILLHAGIFLLVLAAAINVKNMGRLIPGNDKAQLSGFRKEILESGIAKFENKEALVYLKPLAFYAAEHSPAICWKGSGYKFQSINKEVIGGKELYSGILVKGNDKLYSAWWFQCGSASTINQFEWRWKAARGNKRFFLVNVSAENKNNLEKMVVAVREQL